MRTFSLDEAQTLIPVLEALLKRAMQSRESAETVEREMQQLSQRIFLNGGMLVSVAQVARRRAEHDTAVQQVKDTLQEMDAIGVQVKDIEKGLLDFPCRLGEETVLLCWKMGETEITHWHTVDAGFPGRQPIDERFRRGQKQKPN
ncbi:MAG TPA: DUF2203 domain-containing protein [Acidobacteriaceae bacterium]|jgi:hypothetical protein|nr:DUF2203 domain-containing protein [Acidobacteriaceae bacterium]